MTDEERVTMAAAALAEFFDTVQIFCSKHDSAEDATYKYEAGCGNLLARMYQAETWVGEQQTYSDEDEEDDD